MSVRLLPARANQGIVFRRTDLEGFEIEAQARHVARVSYATSLMKRGVLISTTEHLLSALAASGVDNVVVEIDNLELPILDGSAGPFVRLIEQAGRRRQRARRRYAKVLEPVELVDGAKRIAVYPDEAFRITYHISFAHPLIGDQSFDLVPAPGAYAREVAPSRTFGFADEIEGLRRNGLIRGGSLENAVVLTRDGVMNALRFPDEFCRHKVLDLIGDLALLGHPLVGHVVADRAGHAMHFALVSALLRNKSAWTLMSSSELESPPAQALVGTGGAGASAWR